jgi:hypothetical protein
MGSCLILRTCGNESWAHLFLSAAPYWTHKHGDDDKWHNETFDLTAFLVANFNLRFVSKAKKNDEIAEIDEVRIQGVRRSCWKPSIIKKRKREKA